MVDRRTLSTDDHLHARALSSARLLAVHCITFQYSIYMHYSFTIKIVHKVQKKERKT